MKSFLFVSVLPLLSRVIAFPQYGSLAGLSKRELDEIIPLLQVREPSLPPGPMLDTATKLVNDEAHPWKALESGDIRGPCPGLNTLASHGVHSRTFVSTPKAYEWPSIFLEMAWHHPRKSSTQSKKVNTWLQLLGIFF